VFLASSGRTALFYLLSYLKELNSGRSAVIMPAYTCPVLAKVSLDVGLNPVFVDISPLTFQFDPDRLKAAVDESTLAIVVVHPFGLPLSVGEPRRLADRVGAFLIEDSAQALGARWQGKAVGTRADFGLFSLGPGKPLSTAGGGVLVANRADHLEGLQQWWRRCATPSVITSASAWVRLGLFQVAFHPRGWWAATRLGLHTLGDEESNWGYREQGLAPSQAAIGAALLPRLDDANALRRQNARALMSGIGGVSAFHFLEVSEEAVSIYLRLPLITASEAVRRRLFQQLWSAGIGVGRMYKRTLPALFKSEEAIPYPGAETIARCLLTLPTHHYVTETDSRRMRELLVETGDI
jgi:dTDP-4-amino-4,6-dideoxygalactose transaminase